MSYRVCRPDHDETAWHDVEATDPEGAAEKHAIECCQRDPENYGSFEGDGELVLVSGGFGGTVVVRVSVELVPSFTARRVR